MQMKGGPPYVLVKGSVGNRHFQGGRTGNRRSNIGLLRIVPLIERVVTAVAVPEVRGKATLKLH